MRVLIADKFETAGVEGLRRIGCEVVIDPGKKGAELIAAVRAANPAILIVRSTKVDGALMDAAAYEKVLLTVYKHENPTSPGEGLENASEKALWSGTKGEFCATQNGVDWWACIYWAAFLS